MNLKQLVLLLVSTVLIVSILTTTVLGQAARHSQIQPVRGHAERHRIRRTDRDHRLITMDHSHKKALQNGLSHNNHEGSWKEGDDHEQYIINHSETTKNHKRGIKKFQGTGTYFTPNKGNCGWSNDQHDQIVALSTTQYNGGKHCGKWLKVCSKGKCIDAQVADSCPGCANGSLDMSPRVFKALAPLSVGEIPITWRFNNNK